jgi:hypothetical protein
MGESHSTRKQRQKIKVGDEFDRLVILAFADRSPSGKLRWLCRCTCGAEVIVIGNCLQSRNTRSCGCLAKEKRTTHGLLRRGEKRPPEYGAWADMIQRCQNENLKSYADYGARGIRVCDRWRTSFVDFLADVGPKPSKKHSLDRINNDGHYEPGNVRWATRIEQESNKRNNHLIIYNGRTQTITQWGREFGIPTVTIYNRLVDYGWPVSPELFAPARRETVPLAIRRKAYHAVTCAVKAGVLPRAASLPCSRCGMQAKKYQHHKGFDSAHWLEITPLCSRCHAQTTCH